MLYPSVELPENGSHIYMDTGSKFYPRKGGEKNAKYHREQVLSMTQGTQAKKSRTLINFLMQSTLTALSVRTQKKNKSSSGIKDCITIQYVFDHCSTDQEEQKTDFNASLLLRQSDGSFQESIFLLHLLLCISGAGTSGWAGGVWRVCGRIGWAGC